MAEAIPIGADHAGFAMKRRLVKELADLGYDPQDLGSFSEESVDYPDYAHLVTARITSGQARRGILLCGTGNGMAMAANRHHGIRAALAWNLPTAHLSREHNDANVLVLPARCLGMDEGVAILKEWLSTPFAGGRHQRRVAKIEDSAPDDRP